MGEAAAGGADRAADDRVLAQLVDLGERLNHSLACASALQSRTILAFGLRDLILELRPDLDRFTVEQRFESWKWTNAARNGLREMLGAAALRPAGDVEQIAQFVADWNGATRDGDTFLIAEEIREKFGSKGRS